MLRLQQTAGNMAVAQLLHRAVVDAPTTKRKLVCWGVKGTDVRHLQTRLNLAPEVTILLDVDGDFGPLTYAAVKQFQRKHPPLKPDGIVGEETWAAVEAIPDEPTDREAMSTKYYEAAAVHYGTGHFGHAADFFEMAGEWSAAPELVFNRAQALRQLGGRRKEAMALYEQFIAQVGDADSALAKRLLAELRGPGKTGDKAAEAKSADALYARGAKAYEKGRYGEAADLFELSGESAEAPELLFNRAQALRRLGGRRKEAIALYEQFIAQVGDADSALAKRLLAQLRGPGKTGNADADAKAANELYERAAAAYKKGRYGEALDLFEAASEVEDAPELLFNRAQALRLLGGRRKDAMALYAAFIAKVGDEDSELARRLLAELTVPDRHP